MPAICCGLAPMLFGSRPLKIVQRLKTYKKSKVSKNLKEIKRSRKDGSSQPVSNFILMMELRKKIIAFRDIIDLPPCSTSVATDKLLLGTLKDLHKFYPGSLPHFRRSELKGLTLDKMLIYFCKALQELGDTSKMTDELIDKYKYDIYENDRCKNIDKLVEIARAKLNGLIKLAREKFDMADEDDENKDSGPKANTFGKVLKDSYSNNSSYCPSPTSVLPELVNGSPKSPHSSSVLLSLRVQSVGRLNPIDVKLLKLHMLPNVGLQLPTCLSQNNATIEEQKEEAKVNSSSVDGTIDSISRNETLEDPSSDSDNASDGSITKSPSTTAEVSSPSSPSQRSDLSTDTETDIELLPSPSSPSRRSELSTDMETDIELLPSPSAPSAEVILPPSPPPPPPPPLLQPKVVSGGPPLPPPPMLQPKLVSGNASATPPPPPHIMLSERPGASPPPPPSMSLANEAAAPPPPPPATKSLRPKRTSSTKLMRSSHMGNLYRNLKGKVEGYPVQGKSFIGKKTGAASSSSGKQGMADALAEMTKRSAYFQQIEEDAEKYAESIQELKTAIGQFNTKEMIELIKFHKHVESILENLTDETQVLARFDGFPTKKLEALRAASALYSKLQSMIVELQNWKTEPPLAQLLDKVARYFNKIKGEIDNLERTKDDERKTFKNYNINFDFQILVRIKEAMVDVSSNCMELALKERREAKLAKNKGSKTKAEAQNKGSTKLLWTAFQLAFQVYTFAGGHDDRAEKLTQELAKEIENDPENQ